MQEACGEGNENEDAGHGHGGLGKDQQRTVGTLSNNLLQPQRLMTVQSLHSRKW